MFVFAIILAIIAAGVYITSRFLKLTKTENFIPEGGRSYDVQHREVPNRFVNKLLDWIAIGFFALAVLIFALGSFYTQQEGTANVEVDITGKAIRVETEAGFHLKWPWVNTVEFNVRNQPVAFGGSSKDFNANQGAGYAFDGPQVTVNTSDGVKVDQDLQVTYSIKPDAVLGIYRDWKTEDAFKQGLVFQDIRNTVREAGNSRSTLDLITGIADFGADIDTALREKWAERGVIVNQVNLQEPRPPQSVTDSYAQAQEAEINVTTEQSKLDATKISSQKQVVEAQAQADANKLLSESLTPQVLQQRMIDAYKAGTVFVVPNDFSGILNLPNAK